MAVKLLSKLVFSSSMLRRGCGWVFSVKVVVVVVVVVVGDW